jgi:hypothetical protein
MNPIAAIQILKINSKDSKLKLMQQSKIKVAQLIRIKNKITNQRD